jgi:hypothetical protein
MKTLRDELKPFLPGALIAAALVLLPLLYQLYLSSAGR